MGKIRSKQRFGNVTKSINHFCPFLCLSLITAAAGCGLYGVNGYSPAITLLWIGSILAGGLHFLGRPAELPLLLVPAKSDLWVLGALAADLRAALPVVSL